MLDLKYFFRLHLSLLYFLCRFINTFWEVGCEAEGRTKCLPIWIILERSMDTGVASSGTLWNHLAGCWCEPRCPGVAIVDGLGAGCPGAAGVDGLVAGGASTYPLGTDMMMQRNRINLRFLDQLVLLCIPT